MFFVYPWGTLIKKPFILLGETDYTKYLTTITYNI
jgi:hypothetical protein